MGHKIFISYKYAEQLCVRESFDKYIYYLNNYLHPIQSSGAQKKGIIISGAFPDCEPDCQHFLTDAIYSFTQAIFLRNGIVIFGAHPTFQHLIFNMAKLHRPKDFKRLYIYISLNILRQMAL